MQYKLVATQGHSVPGLNLERAIPSRAQAIAFFLKAWVFRAKRMVLDPNGKRPRKLQQKQVDQATPVIAESRSILYGSTHPAEFALQAGKLENLRIAARYLNGLVIPAGGIFSFWAHVPRPTGARGFAKGRELREGCVIPSNGGGMCQISNALYDAAMNAGFEIVERHEHSRSLPGSMAERERDATIFWNYIDLRFRAKDECQMEVSMGRDELAVRFRSRGGEAVHGKASAGTARKEPTSNTPVESCETCGVAKCFRHHEISTLPRNGVTAWLVDAWSPEHDAYLRKNHKAGDWLFTPLDSRRFGLGPYLWNSAGFANVRQSPLMVAARSIQSRRLAAQGAARQRALLEMDEKLARLYQRRIPYTATHLVVSQNLLPFLWKNGVLGGRTFDVLMTRLPMGELQAVLDRAAARWPGSSTLADFRAPVEIEEAETAALAEARQWITPHSAIARLAGERAVKLDWELPPPDRRTIHEGGTILFPASTLGRKGAYEVREAAKALGLKVMLGGPMLEEPAFWNGIDTTRLAMAADDAFPRDIFAVVLPAWVENQPRRLLKALSAGLPVIASENCGLSGVPGITEIPTGDVGALQAALAALGSHSVA